MRRPSLRFTRRAVQTAVLVLMALVPALNARGLHGLGGNFFYFEAFGLPLADPLAALQVFASSGAWGWRLAAGAACALALAAALGPVFCSWVCPFGLLSELGNALRGPRARGAARGPSRAFGVRLALAAAGLCVVGLAGLPPLLNHLSLPGWYARAWQEGSWEVLAAPAVPVLACALALEALAGRRLWCRWLCPQSVLPALSGRLNPWSLRVRFSPARCTCGKAAPCRGACTLELDPRRPGGPGLECTNCGDCVGACARRGRALSLSLARDADSTGTPSRG